MLQCLYVVCLYEYIHTGTLGCGASSVDYSGFKFRSEAGVAETTDLLCQQGCIFGTYTEMTGAYTSYINSVMLINNKSWRYWCLPPIFRSQMIVLCVMFCEAFVILVLDKGHFRIMRALRPVLLLDGFLMAGVRRYGGATRGLNLQRCEPFLVGNCTCYGRVMWQIILCIKYILDVMLVLFFMTAVFGLMG